MRQPRLILILASLPVAVASWWLPPAAEAAAILVLAALAAWAIGAGRPATTAAAPPPPAPAEHLPGVQAVRCATLALSATSGELLETAERTTASAQGAAASAAQVSANTATIAAAAEEMTAAIREIAMSTSRSAGISADASKRSRDIDAAVQQLGRSSLEVGTVAKTIGAIAEQTNLLALNATIEAARAGDAGRGFAVVAGEVKELSRQTAAATREVEQRIAAIQADTERATTAIKAIAGLIAELDGLQQASASAVEEQSATTAEMSRGIAEVATGAREIATAIAAVAADARIAATCSVSVHDLCGEAGGHIAGMYRAVRDPAHPGCIPAATVDTVIAAHLGWRARLLAAVQGGTMPDRTQAADHTACGLGGWMRTAGAAVAGDARFQRLDQEHRAFHAEVARLLGMIAAGKGEAARGELAEGAFRDLSRRVVALLAEMREDDDPSTGAASLQWDPAYATGHGGIDAQHRELFQRASALYRAMHAGEGREKVIQVLDYLAAYVVDHFRDEEAAMREAGYPALADHQRLHRELVAQVQQLHAGIVAGQPIRTMEVRDFLANWLREHILKRDHAYIPALRGAGLIADARPG